MSELSGLIDQFLEYLEIERNCSKLTIRDYRHYLVTFAKWYGERKIEDFDLSTVRKYRVFLANKEYEKGLTLKRVTQNYYVIALRSFLRFLIKNDFKTLEPSKIDLPKAESRNLKFLSKEQVEQLIQAVDISKEEGLRDRAILELLFSTGLRVSELVSLNHEQVNLERREFGVIGKGSKLRLVFISDHAADWVAKYMNERKDTFKPLFIRYSGKIIEDYGGEKMRLTARSVERIVKKYVKRARLPVDATVHTLRHSFATDLLNNGADIRSVQEMLGHKNIATTQIYTHITNPQLRDTHRSFHSGNK
jgi:site-specific recombinase XerD